MHRFDGFIYNFQSPDYTIETLGSIFLVLGLPVYLFLIGKKELSESKLFSKSARVFWVTLIINTFIVILFTRARESRLFVLPLFFLWPVFASLFLDEMKLIFSKKNYLQVIRNWKLLGLFLLLIGLNYLLSFHLYNSNEGAGDYFNEYFFVIVYIISSHFLFKFALPRMQNSELSDFHNANSEVL